MSEIKNSRSSLPINSQQHHGTLYKVIVLYKDRWQAARQLEAGEGLSPPVLLLPFNKAVDQSYV